jgi:hypothetical protein
METEMARLPKRVIVIPVVKKKERVSKADKIMIRLNPDMLEAIKEDELCYRDRIWFERNAERLNI